MLYYMRKIEPIYITSTNFEFEQHQMLCQIANYSITLAKKSPNYELSHGIIYLLNNITPM